MGTGTDWNLDSALIYIEQCKKFEKVGTNQNCHSLNSIRNETEQDRTDSSTEQPE